MNDLLFFNWIFNQFIEHSNKNIMVDIRHVLGNISLLKVKEMSPHKLSIDNFIFLFLLTLFGYFKLVDLKWFLKFLYLWQIPTFIFIKFWILSDHEYLRENLFVQYNIENFVPIRVIGLIFVVHDDFKETYKFRVITLMYDLIHKLIYNLWIEVINKFIIVFVKRTKKLGLA